MWISRVILQFRMERWQGSARPDGRDGHGEMAERTNAAVLKTVGPVKGPRGFESPSLRH